MQPTTRAVLWTLGAIVAAIIVYRAGYSAAVEDFCRELARQAFSTVKCGAS